MKLRALLLFLAVVLVASLVGGSTLALYTSTSSSQNNTFSSGNLEIALTDATGEPLQGAIMQVDLLAPGDAPGPFNASLKNTGTLPLVYNYTIVRTDAGGAKNDALATALLLKLERQKGDGSWESIDEQSLAAWVSQGASDWQPDLAAGALDHLRLTANLPTATGNEAQSASVTFTLLVNATQPVVADQQPPQTETWTGSYVSGSQTWPFVATVTRNGGSFTGTMTEQNDPFIGTTQISGTISGNAINGVRIYPTGFGSWNVSFSGTLNPNGTVVLNGTWTAFGPNPANTWGATKQ